MNGDYIAWMAACLNLVACFTYALSRDIPRAFYWGGAFVIVISTVFMRK